MDNKLLNSYIRELKGGSHKAFNAIYEIYAGKLFSFALAHTRSRELAGDVVQETFLKLWSMRESLKEENTLQSLLFTIANSRIIDMFRKQINQTEMELYLRYMQEEQAHNNVENRINYDDFVKSLRLCKKLLTARQLEIFELSKEKGKSITEISEMLILSEQTVKNQLTSALKRMKEGLLKINIILLILLSVGVRF